MGVEICRDRDDLLTDFGKLTLSDRYLQNGESYQDAFARVAVAYGDDDAHAQRIYDYISKLWFMPATPVLANGGTKNGLPISCYLKSVDDTMESILKTFYQTGWLSCRGGGIGTYWGKIREIGAPFGNNNQPAEGIVGWLRIEEAYARAVNQGDVRAASVAFYLDIDHPEIEEFIDIRHPSGDLERKTLDAHIGVNITDKFMDAVMQDGEFDLISRKDGSVVHTLKARYLWEKILDMRMAKGEPYLNFIDTVNRKSPAIYKTLGYKVTQSNLCTEITLKTGVDNEGEERTAVCCLSSVNAEKYLEWKDQPNFLLDIYRFLDNVLQDFINQTEGLTGFEAARRGAMKGRDVGLGVMGFHGYLMSRGIAFESPMAKSQNMAIFRFLREGADRASKILALERGACPDAIEANKLERFTHKLAVAPTATISIICGGATPGIEPLPALQWTHKTLSGSTIRRCSQFERWLEDWYAVNHERADGMDQSEFEAKVWDYVLHNDGSIQGFPIFTEIETAVWKTAFEIDQNWVAEFAGDRANDLDQGQSVNVFFPGDADKRYINQVHLRLYNSGVKAAYYCRSKSVVQAKTVGHDSAGVVDPTYEAAQECLSCQ